LAGEAADGAFVADVGLAEAAAAEAAEVGVGVDEYDGLTEASGLDGGDDAAGGAAVDADSGFEGGGSWGGAEQGRGKYKPSNQGVGFHAA
jgi:hypothetical protein